MGNESEAKRSCSVALRSRQHPKTAATYSTPPIRDEPMDISEVAEPVDPRDKAFKQSDYRMRAIIALLEDSGQGYPNTGSNQPLRPNPSVTSITPCPKVTNFTTLQTEPRTVEELTAGQLKAVFQYITTSNTLREQVRALVIPPKESTPTRPREYHDVARIVFLLQTLQQLGENMTKSFHDLAVLLVRNQPLEFRYTHLMGWIHELTHGITAISVHKDQPNETILPRLLDWSSDQNYFRATLQLFHITQSTITETLQFTSAISAHATRMIRILEAHQMAHMMSKRRLRVTEADEHYRFTSRVAWPKKWSSEPTSHLQTLSWWRKNFSKNLLSSATNEYLNKSTLGEDSKGSTTTTVKSSPPLPPLKKDSNTTTASTSAVSTYIDIH
ncbi:hypothetical protein Aduo_008142 [Ancylostoma duodenale]